MMIGDFMGGAPLPMKIEGKNLAFRRLASVVAIWIDAVQNIGNRDAERPENDRHEGASAPSFTFNQNGSR